MGKQIRRTMLISGVSVVFLSACSFGGCKRAGEATYGGTPVFDRYDTVSPAVLATGLDLNYPKQMFAIDTVIGVVDANAAHDCYVHLFNEQGKPLKRIGKKGKGPGEIAGFSGCFVNKKSRTVSFFCRTKVVEYDLDLLFGGSSAYYRDLEIPKMEGGMPDNGFWLDENRFFWSGRAEDRRFAILDREGGRSVYRDYPMVTDNQEQNRAVFGLYTVMGFNEGLDRFVQGTYIGGILDIFRIAEGDIVPQRTVYLYEPRFYPVKNAPSHVSWGDETTIGFEALDCSDLHIYTLLNGVKGSAFKRADAVFDPPHADCLSVFDWNGRPVRSVSLNKKLVTVAVKDDSTAHFVAFDEGYSLVRASL